MCFSKECDLTCFHPSSLFSKATPTGTRVTLLGGFSDCTVLDEESSGTAQSYLPAGHLSICVICPLQLPVFIFLHSPSITIHCSQTKFPAVS